MSGDRWGRLISKTAAFTAVLILGLAGLLFVFAAAEPLLRVPNAADWIQAIGGLAAISATAFIAFNESRRSRKQLDVQIALQRQSIEHQISLQNAALEHNATIIRESETRLRLRAVAAVKTAYQLVATALKCVDGPVDESFIDTWKSDFDLARRIMENIDYSHLSSELEIHIIGTMSVDVIDIWNILNKAKNASTPSFHNYCTGLAKRKAKRFAKNLTVLDKDWADTSEDRLDLTPAEIGEIPKEPT